MSARLASAFLLCHFAFCNLSFISVPPCFCGSFKNMSEEFLCVRCARHMKTCCQTCEIYTTLGDVQRIAAHVGREDFHEFRAPANPVYIDHDDDPTWRDGVFQADGSRRVLKKQAGGDCTFLGERGCVLPIFFIYI